MMPDAFGEVRRCSASWLAMNISILRTVFDKIHGLSLLEGLRGPKRPDRLPRILSREQTATLRTAAEDFREALLIGLLLDGGLRIGEACALQWADVLTETGELRVAGSGNARFRSVPIPTSLAPLLQEDKYRFDDSAHVFPGRRPGAPLSTRMAERLVRRSRRRYRRPDRGSVG